MLPKPWITELLDNACYRKNRQYYEFVKNPSDENKALYEKLCKFCEKHIAIAKNKYFQKYFDDYADNSRKNGK